MTAAQPRPSAEGRRAPRTIFVVLPAFNEGPGIGSLLDRLDDAMAETLLAYRVILVDDGSRDDTAAVAADRAATMPITIVRHPENMGLGATIRDGLIEAERQAETRDVIVTMDADDTHAPGLILRMARMLGEGYDVVIASRYRRESRSIGVPASRRLLSYAASLLFRMIYPIKGVRDYTCGFRAYRVEVLRMAIDRYGRDFLDQDGFQCMVDILLKLRKLSLIFGEVPFLLRYDFKEGGTKMNVPETVHKTLALMLRSKFSR